MNLQNTIYKGDTVYPANRSSKISESCKYHLMAHQTSYPSPANIISGPRKRHQPIKHLVAQHTSFHDPSNNSSWPSKHHHVTQQTSCDQHTSSHAPANIISWPSRRHLVAQRTLSSDTENIILRHIKHHLAAQRTSCT